MKKLTIQALGSLLAVFICMGILLFLPAGTFDYWQAWVFLIAFNGAGLVIILYLAARDPQLLARRMSVKPVAGVTASEKISISLSSLGFVALLIFPALDHRSGWSTVPTSVSIVADVVFALGWLIIFFVFKENTFTATFVRVEAEQTVTTTGPYAIVRHPMYSGSLLYVLAMPVALGSWWSLLIVLLMMPSAIWRIFSEESLLKKQLAGYTDYTQKVRYRIIPFVW